VDAGDLRSGGVEMHEPAGPELKAVAYSCIWGKR